jgi:hypothetical protein
MAELIDETGTPSKCGLKRGQPESPDGLSTIIKQTERQIRARQGSVTFNCMLVVFYLFNQRLSGC